MLTSLNRFTRSSYTRSADSRGFWVSLNITLENFLPCLSPSLLFQPIKTDLLLLAV